MKREYTMALIAVIGLSTAAFSAPKGTAPRSSAARYPAHAESGGVSIGAQMLSRDETRKLFVSDVNRCCVVLEIAVYPEKSMPGEVSLNDFALRVKGGEASTKPSSAKVIAASLQKKAAGDRDITVYPTTGIGYSSGNVYDPATGTRRAGGVYKQAGVGIGIGSPGGPASTEKDRDVMEAELSDKGLPEGAASVPVAGYVYFALVPGKKKAAYQLEYMLNGTKIVLELPLR